MRNIPKESGKKNQLAAAMTYTIIFVEILIFLVIFFYDTLPEIINIARGAVLFSK